MVSHTEQAPVINAIASYTQYSRVPAAVLFLAKSDASTTYTAYFSNSKKVDEF
jgi:hypothetical protein